MGEDSLKRSRTLEKLRGRLEELGDLAFNSDALDGELAEGGDIVTACNTVPFASEKRLVHVRNADKLKKVDAEAVVSYLKSPCETTVLLLEAEKPVKNTRLYKAVARHRPRMRSSIAPSERQRAAAHIRASPSDAAWPSPTPPHASSSSSSGRT